MKTGLFALFISTALSVLPAPSSPASPDSRAALERLKTLVGRWESTVKGSSSGPGTVTYSLTGGGSVLVENAGGMMTAYHLDKNQLVLTHFCGAGNQPRMRIKAADDRHIAFEMYDITNLADPQAYHSTNLDVVFLGADRVDLAYGGTRGGTATTQVFQLTRKSSAR
jgi:hypothetical protein